MLSDRIADEFGMKHIKVHPIINDFFGHDIDVTGLLTGQDIVKQLKDIFEKEPDEDKKLDSYILLPCSTLKSGEDIFLDDMTLEFFENTLQKRVRIVKSSGSAFVGSFMKDYERDYYSNELQKINDNKDYLKLNYFTSQIMQDIPFNSNGNTILFSKLYFNEEHFNDFINNLKYNNKNSKNNTNNNNINDNPYGIDLDELKEFIFKDESNINSDLFAIRNWKNKALIQINIDLNMNSENEDNDIFYNNINCFLLISNKDLNNYCELNQKLFSKGNLCLYVIIPWEQFNIFNYEHLCFKVIIFNHNK